jgi:uncharacterized repeat protein (TIGR01451 family)
VTNTASASGGGVTSPTDTETVTAVADASLTVAKASTTPEIAAAGQVVPYRFTVRNTGNITLTGVTLVDPLCTSAISGPAGDTNDDGALQVTELWTYTCSRTVTQGEFDAGGDLSNTVTADSAQTGPTNDTLDIPIVPAVRPAISLTKTITRGAEFSAVGDVISYEYVVTNTGDVTLEGPLAVSDDRTTVTCPPTSSLDPAESVTCTATDVVTQADLDAGIVTNVATATASYGSVEVASGVVSASARVTARPTLPPSSTLDRGRATGEVAGIGLGILVVLVVVTLGLLLIPSARRRTARR